MLADEAPSGRDTSSGRDSFLARPLRSGAGAWQATARYGKAIHSKQGIAGGGKKNDAQNWRRSCDLIVARVIGRGEFGELRFCDRVRCGLESFEIGVLSIGVFQVYHDGPGSAASITSMKVTGPPASVMTHASRVFV